MTLSKFLYLSGLLFLQVQKGDYLSTYPDSIFARLIGTNLCKVLRILISIEEVAQKISANLYELF